MKKHPKRRWTTIGSLSLIGVIVLAIAAIVLVRHIYQQNLLPVSRLQNQVEINVPTGSTVTEIGNKLKTAGLIRQSWAFEWYIRSHNLRDKLEAGTYSFSPSEDVATIANILAQGKVATNLVTILPEKRIDQIRASMINSGFSPADVTAAMKPEQYSGHPALVDKPVSASLEGYLYPESFQKTGDTTASQIIRASLDEMQKRLTPEVRAGMAKQGLGVYEGITLASIIGSEVNKNSDKPIVAQVFLSRLRANMLLQSDVTAYYGAILAGQPPSLSYDSPYNTHIHAGLPPGPISNVTSEDLNAVVSPASTDYLYFVAGDDGNTYFAHTLQEHQQNVAQHCQRLCQPWA